MKTIVHIQNLKFGGCANTISKKLNDLDGAIKNYNLAISNKPNFAEAHNNIGVVFQKLRNFDQAILQYKKAICFYKIFFQKFQKNVENLAQTF
jgi:tetratricopeptide (TPR) repeat protein